ncbi:hypothetical protein FHS16_006070 [Paenibacillus endophyticus]|uniref:Sporulation protein n=1 Tax=Paenibacillus endophyticus TaxID=1294268 RepID=A0A7W5CEV5_9BACL|nr:hypothetical protein [Paenibacillus endophyticus]MBB3155954.1 hypothetical protein [Paenibacillus endophyticus]
MEKKRTVLTDRLASYRISLMLLLVLLLAITLTACGSSKQDKMKTYGHDGYMGYSNSNPNLPNRLQYLNYNADGDMIEQVLKPINGIEHTRIYFNGTDLHVNLDVASSLSDGQVEQLRAKAQSVVQHNMPRYNVHVEAKR